MTKQLNFNKYVIRNPAIKKINKEEITNIVKVGNKRRPLCIQSSLGNGFINENVLMKRNDLQMFLYQILIHLIL